MRGGGGGAMSRTQAVLPGGPRLSDYLSIGVLAQVYPIGAVRKALASCGRASLRQRALPAEAMVYYVVALGLFRSVSAREVLRCLMEGLRWVSSDRDAARVGEVIDFASEDALGVCAVRGVARGPGGAGGGPGDARVVVSRPAPGGVRRVHAERAGRGDETGRCSGRPARRVAVLLSPRCA